MNPTVRSARQAATSAINGAKSHGPKTSEGKATSSLNSIRFGFTAAHLLLPGEDPAAYEAFLDSWFSALAPTTMPEAASVAQLADTSWKLERLSRVENGRIRARLEEELETTNEFKTYDNTRMALAMMTAFVESVEAIPTPPKDAERTSAFLTGVEKTVNVLREVPGLPMAVVEPLAFALKTAQENEEAESIPPAIYENLGNMAQVVKGALSMKLAEEEAALGPVRERLAAEVLLLEDADLKKLERHRRTLETTMERQLAIFHQLRAEMANTTTENTSETQALRVKLRLVK
jgi:DNA replication protein DnaC